MCIYWLIEGQTDFGMPRGTGVSLDLNELKKVALHSNSDTNLQACTTSGKKELILYAKQVMENHRG
jgi:hypothetical protein